MDHSEYDDFLTNVYKLLNKVIFFYFERKIYSFTTYDGFIFINLYTLTLKILEISHNFLNFLVNLNLKVGFNSSSSKFIKFSF